MANKPKLSPYKPKKDRKPRPGRVEAMVKDKMDKEMDSHYGNSYSNQKLKPKLIRKKRGN